ncbi:AraC family transcriptional regulator [Tistrella bauzanensis]|uniref:AraC family transcriptional regulator n=1 Tax=Tistrella bauzanensis TaxID=657419 RepID=A0ABQ1IYU0_9PROT|nr:AraC family transcriptional regulator [Tistrella bauzanensis]GGB54518.1 AraC family transcriptional regulator [Tistrella bauzanensis]
MISSHQFGTITTGAIYGLHAVIKSKGGRPEDVFARIGLSGDPDCGVQPVLPLASFTATLEAAASEVGSSTFGLDFGRAFDIRRLGGIGEVFHCDQTVGAALEKFCRYLPTAQDNSRAVCAVSGDLARVSYEIEDPTVHERVQDANFTLALKHDVLKWLLGPRFSASWVEFRHQPDGDAADYRHHFGCPVRFGAGGNALVFPARWLETPIATADPRACHQVVARLADDLATRTARIDFTGGIEAWITEAMCRAAPIELEHVAADLGMSARTLQRRLDQCGVSFADLRNTVRRRLAVVMLTETAMPVTLIALHLGYSETSAFTRAFKAMTGRAPLAFRNEAGAGAG